MTLKQFGLLTGGCVVGLIFYALPLASYFKWPLVFFSGFAGFAFAFMPIEERPLDRWVVAFLKAIYSPTQFIWKKRLIEPEFFKVSSRPRLAIKEPVAPPDQERLAEYLKTLPVDLVKNPLDQQEESALNQITNLFQLTPLPLALKPSVAPRPTEEEEKPGIKIRKLHFPSEEQIKIEKEEERLPPTLRPIKKALPIKKPVRPDQPTVQATIAPDLPIPAPPERPNLLVGMVLDQENKLIENAILEIRDGKGNPVRALKTNKLGQFRIATPLKDGPYEIEVEKEGLNFDLIRLELEGKIVQPIEIKAK